MGKTANPRTEALVAQDAAEAQERVQEASVGAPRCREPDKRARHRQSA